MDEFIGQQAGNYRITSKLGAGGMGAVYLAEHPVIGKRVVVKVLHRTLLEREEYKQRFVNEARLATLAKHPGLVDVFDFGYLPNGCAFLLMEYLEGETLTALVRRHGRLPTALALDLGRQAATALDVVHSRGIVHRDLKPDNLFILPDHEQPGRLRVKILDFGIAKLSDESMAGGMTRTGAFMGTPLYMAPEQCHGAKHVDHRADIYALGCLIYEMLAGRPPFTGTGHGEVVAAHLYAEPPSLGQLLPELAPDIVAAVHRLLAKAPEGRVQSMAEVAALLERLGRAGTAQLPATLQMPVLDETAAPAHTTLSNTASERVEHAPAWRPRWQISAAVTVLLTVLGLGSYWFLTTTTSHPSSAVPDVEPIAAAPSPPAPAPQAQPETPKPAVPAESAAPAEPSSPSTVHLRIAAHPAGAHVFRNGSEDLGEAPVVDEQPAGPGRKRYVVRLNGYAETQVSLPLQADAEHEVTLTPLPRAPAPSPETPAATAAPTRIPRSKARPTAPTPSKPSRPAPSKETLDPFAQ